MTWLKIKVTIYNKITLAVSSPTRLFTEDMFGSGGIGGGPTTGGTGDFATGGITGGITGGMTGGMTMSFLLPGGISSGGNTLGMAYFSNALYTRCMACEIIYVKSINNYQYYWN